MAEILLGLGRDGGMAERVTVPPAALVPLPEGVPLRDACLVEPLAVAVHGAHRAGVGPEERVLVVGGGTIGLCAVAACRDAGAPVDLLARHDHQRAAGERLGAGPPDGEGYDVVVDAVGSSHAVCDALRRVRSGGRLLLLGTYWDGLDLPAVSVCTREVDLVPASLYCGSAPRRDVDLAARLLAEHPEVASTLVTHRYPLDAAPEAFAAAADRAAGAIKVVLDPRA